MYGSFVPVTNCTLRIIPNTISKRKIKDWEYKAKGNFLSQLNAFKQNASCSGFQRDMLKCCNYLCSLCICDV